MERIRNLEERSFRGLVKCMIDDDSGNGVWMVKLLISPSPDISKKSKISQKGIEDGKNPTTTSSVQRLFPEEHKPIRLGC